MPKETQEQVSKCCGAKIETEYEYIRNIMGSAYHTICVKCGSECEPVASPKEAVVPSFLTDKEKWLCKCGHEATYHHPDELGNGGACWFPTMNDGIYDYSCHCQRFQPVSPEPAVVKPENPYRHDDHTKAGFQCVSCVAGMAWQEGFAAGQKKLPSVDAIAKLIHLGYETDSAINNSCWDCRKAGKVAAAILELWKGE